MASDHNKRVKDLPYIIIGLLPIVTAKILIKIKDSTAKRVLDRSRATILY